MGIPVFFKTLITDYTHVIKPISSKKVDNLFFDLNCLIHPCCAKVTDGNEQTMITTILETIHTLIELTGATFVYIAVDGPAPKAKMIQQRTRRHKSVLEGKPWDTNAITPGTTFMNTLNTALHAEFIQPNIVISDSSEPGEGEHKILQYIKHHKKMLSKQSNCIYGLDADLIVLSLLSGMPDICLLRERTSFNIEQMDCEYLYLDIKALRKEILNEFPKLQIPSQTIIHDYCFICFLVGNDFIQHSPSLILRYDGLSHIIAAYKQCQEKHNYKFYLINPKTKGLIHWEHFKTFIHHLSLTENDRLADITHIRLQQHRKYRRIYDDIQRNKDVVKSNQYKHSFPSEDIQRHMPIIFMEDEKNIFARKEGWKERYNTFALTKSHDTCPVHVLHEQVTTLCHEYIKSLVWTSHYYFQECISQEWSYPYEFAPTLQDLHNYLMTCGRVRIPPHTQVCSTKDQLQFIFPKQSYGLSTELDGCDSDIKEFTGFENTFRLLKRYDWECEPTW
jgi:5'-3' exoribonuclease 1